MDDLRYQWVAAKADDECITSLAGEIMHMVPGIKVLKTPKAGLLMLRARESVENKPFNVGEVLITECVVIYGEDSTGWGCCLGEEITRAFNLAVLDLAWRYFPEWKPKLIAALESEEKRLLQEESLMAALVESTSVKFEVR